MKRKTMYIIRRTVLGAASMGLLATVALGSGFGISYGPVQGSSHGVSSGGSPPSWVSSDPGSSSAAVQSPFAEISHDAAAGSRQEESAGQEERPQVGNPNSAKPDGGEQKGSRTVYLTFDDGPSRCTPQILEILKKNGIKATFFVIYNPVGDFYRQIVAEGHTIGLHSYTHRYNQIYAGEEGFFDDLGRLSDYIKSLTGIESKITRFPGGGGNTVSKKYSIGIMSLLVQQLAQRGYRYYDWNVSAGDASSTKLPPDKLLENVKKHTCSDGVPKPFVILLMHDSSEKQHTVDALQSIIDYYKSLDYDFQPITMDTPTIHQPVVN